MERLISPVSSERDEEIQRQLAEERIQQRNKWRWNAWSDLIRERGKRYESCRLTNYEVTTERQQKVLDAVTAYGESIKQRIDSGEGLLLIGPSGTGKDHLLVGLARIAIANDIQVIWTSGPNLFSSVREAINSETETPHQLIKKLAKGSVLVLSDLLPSSGKLTEFQSDCVYQLVDERYNRMLPTWLAVNIKGRDELETGVGVPVVDRLAHGSTVLACDWPSYRRSR